MNSTACSSKECRGCYQEIAEVITCTKSLYWLQTKARGSTDELNRIWCALGDMVEDMLLRKRSCVIPDFLHASIKVQHVTYFDGDRVFHKPQLVLLDDFTSKFPLRNVLEMRDAHYHATTGDMISYTVLGQRTGTDRYITEAAIKDSIREIGKYLQRNPTLTLTIDLAAFALEFKGREYRIKWSEPFLARMRSELGPGSVVTPYDPPSMTTGGPNAACRFDKGCTTTDTMQSQVEATVDAESRTSVTEMNDGKGGSCHRKTYW